MPENIIRFPRTAAGRALLKESLDGIKSSDARLFISQKFDWDEEAVEWVRFAREHNIREAL